MSVVEILTIGNEILDGRVVDTNRVFIGRKLSEIGAEIRFSQTVDDHLDRVVSALNLAASRSDVVVCTGGLGPTTDDLTAEAVAKFLGCEWEVNKDAEAFLKKVFRERNRDLNPSQLKQAKLPTLCSMIDNPVGTAPGFSFSGNFKGKNLKLYFYPGIPKEMHPMFEASVLKDLQPGAFKKHTWSTLFTSEGDMQQKLSAVEKGLAPFRIAFRTHFPENHISLVGAPTGDSEKKLWDLKVKELSQILSPLSYNDGIEGEYEKIIYELLSQNQVQLLLVESCTAGLISHLLSDVPGVSSVLWGSQVCYSNEEKLKLGVSSETLSRFGAVSQECSEEMAKAGLVHLKKIESKGSFKKRIVVTTTGIAGPSGGTDLKPVGLLYTTVLVEEIGTNEIKIHTEKVFAPKFFERKAMKLYFAKKALENMRVQLI